MKKFKVSRFTYTKPNGEVSERTAFILTVPTDKFLALDLSEYSPDEIAGYAKELEELYDTCNEGLKEEIKQLGLSSNYRNFIDERITPGEGS